MDMKENNKKQQILLAVVEIMDKRGMYASISEIARAAGVNDSMIYHYFKNKKDLMFQTAGNYIRDGLDEFAHHLQGVCEPISRLSKLM
jgi:Transcriptional regulator